MQPNSDGKASPGSPFRPPAARIWNNMVDAGRSYADNFLNGGGPNPLRPRETDIIKVKNTSGALRRTGEILKIEGKAINTVTDENKWLLGIEPTDDGYFGILKEPAAIDGIASLQVSGCCMALVNITDEDHKRATSADANYVLQSADDGPIEILFAPDGTGEKTCVVRFAGVSGGGTHEIWFEIESVICNADDSKTLFVTPTYYTGGCTRTIPGEDEYGQIQVEDPCSILAFYTQDFLESGGVKGRATYMYPRGAEYCEPVWLVDQICGQPECA